MKKSLPSEGAGRARFRVREYSKKRFDESLREYTSRAKKLSGVG